VLERTGGNKRRACNVLDISYRTLRVLLSYNAVAERPAPPEEEPPRRPGS
jgi:hypothetical protein